MSIPVEVVFTPNWWFRNYCIPFDSSFYFDRDARIRNDVLMRRALRERFGIGRPAPEPRPVIGSMHVAGGFVVPALLGVEIRFAESQAPWPVCANLSRNEVLRLRVPDIEATWPMNRLIADMDALQKECGCVTGDFNASGVLNTALDLRGNDLFIDMLEEPAIAAHLFQIIAETQCRVASYTKARTGSNSISVNRSIVNVNRGAYVHANCSVPMISPALYERSLLSYEQELARRLAPYGIHHCGGNLQRFAPLYARLRLEFVDVGWGSDVAQCSRALPNAFLNMRLSPVRMLRQTAEGIAADAEQLLAASGRTDNVGLCAINLDHGTPDENVLAVFKIARSFGH